MVFSSCTTVSRSDACVREGGPPSGEEHSIAGFPCFPLLPLRIDFNWPLTVLLGAEKNFSSQLLRKVNTNDKPRYKHEKKPSKQLLSRRVSLGGRLKDGERSAANRKTRMGAHRPGYYEAAHPARQKSTRYALPELRLTPSEKC